MINLTINGKKCVAEDGSTILDAAKQNGIFIPTLCYSGAIDHAVGSCRICVVEVEGWKNLQASCIVKAVEGMNVSQTAMKSEKREKSFLSLSYPTMI